MNRCLNRRRFRSRGMALLMVMIGVVICTILTTGFLSTQGTSLGIARNERDASKCRAIARSGVDMCYWLIRNRPDWRSTMAPGVWINAATVGDGLVTATVADGDGTNNFADDPTQPAIVTSTGTYDGRSFTLTASIRPTGGGTVFYNGNFISGHVSVGNDTLSRVCFIDSFNSAISGYNPSSPGNNAVIGSVSTDPNALSIYFPSHFDGAYAAAPSVLASTVISLLGAAGPPANLSNLVENRVAGNIIKPNTAGLPYQNAFSYVNKPSSWQLGTPGRFDSFTVNADTVNITASGIYYITGDMTIGTMGSSTLQINDGVSAVFIVDGNFLLDSGSIKLLGSTSSLSLYVNGSFTQNKGSFNTSNAASRALILGTNSCSTINFTGNGKLYAAVFAPQANMTLQTNGPSFYGAVIAKSLTLKDSSALHFDEALRSLRISNITGGSAPGGTSDFTVTVLGGPGL